MLIGTLGITRGDSLPGLRARLLMNGVAIDLTDASVVWRMVPESGSHPPLGGTCVIVDAASGLVSYSWKEGETDMVGRYRGQFVVTFGTGDTLTVPGVGSSPIIFEVLARVEDAHA